MTKQQYQIAEQYFAAIVEATAEYAPDDDSELSAWFPFLLMAIGSRESHWGLMLDEEGKGDHGHGHGVFQIDDRSHKKWIDAHDWRDPAVSVQYAAKILRGNYLYFVGKGLSGHLLTRAAVSAYNRGPGNIWWDLKRGCSPDENTTGGDYSSDVWLRARWFHAMLQQDAHHPFRPRPEKVEPEPVENPDLDWEAVDELDEHGNLH